ncbi:hypothetical protein PIB30_015473 [Stylosanthes scabra]|uniref:PB1-like domain-containing protein n=1 Tax=Stylosanthes scabra TaxID=79078 RepID=A0ABU6V5D6_9FABA|nr:hypothetical protein [Stylosanthes scabra]
MDIDLVCLPDLEQLLEDLWFQKYEKLLWHDLSVPDLDDGLHELKGDAGINEMRGATLNYNGPKEFHIYVVHVVDTPVPVENFVDLEGLDSSDSYESAEDEAYKPPPPEYKDADSKSQHEILRSKKKKEVRVKAPKNTMPPTYGKDEATHN